MKITVITPTNTFVLDIHDDLELADFRVFCEIEAAMPKDEMLLTLHGTPLVDAAKSMKQLGCSDGDAIMLERLQSSGGVAASAPPSANQPMDMQRVLDFLNADPQRMATLEQNNPGLADAMRAGNSAEFQRVMAEQMNERWAQADQMERLRNANEFDLEAQHLIAEQIRKKNVDANMEAAMEYNPETFGTVTMLYINCKVNGTPVKAFVDSGAQTTIMSEACANRCNLMHLVDTRYRGIARGVGVSRIVGRVHMVQLQIETAFLATNFSILEDSTIDMLLGLDMLRRHQCNIDLQNNLLHIGTTSSATPFLCEADIPKDREETEAKRQEEEAIAKSLVDAGKAGHVVGSNPGAAGPSGTSAASNSQAASLAAGLAAAARASHATSDASTIRSDDAFTEQTVKDIVALGFTREQAFVELRAHRGNSTQAIAALFAKSLKF